MTRLRPGWLELRRAGRIKWASAHVCAAGRKEKQARERRESGLRPTRPMWVREGWRQAGYGLGLTGQIEGEQVGLRARLKRKKFFQFPNIVLFPKFKCKTNSNPNGGSNTLFNSNKMRNFGKFSKNKFYTFLNFFIF